jgi:hypothetical protein
MRVIVVQYETRRDPALRLLMKLTQDYCDKHSYEYYCPTHEYELPTYWIKVRLVQEIFNRESADDLCVAWIDSDAVVVRESVKIQDILQSANKDFVTSLDPGSTTSMNAGVFFIHKTPLTQHLVNKWMDCYDPAKWYKTPEGAWKTSGKWAGPDYEQGAFNEKILPKFRDEIAMLPEKVLACYEPFYESDTIVCHFMYKHKWKIWVYNTMRSLPEILIWLGIGTTAVLLHNNIMKK